MVLRWRFWVAQRFQHCAKALLSTRALAPERTENGTATMKLHRFHHGPSAKPQRGFTLMELIVASAILSILTLMALPLARITIQREKEKELRRALWEMRDAIDRYKDAADRN